MDDLRIDTASWQLTINGELPLSMPLDSETVSGVAVLLAETGTRAKALSKALNSGANVDDAVDEMMGLYRNVLEACFGTTATESLITYIKDGQELADADIVFQLQEVIAAISRKIGGLIDAY